MALKPNPPCQLSLWEETGVPGENPRLSVEHALYSIQMRTGFEVHIEMNLTGDRTRNLKGERRVV